MVQIKIKNKKKRKIIKVKSAPVEAMGYTFSLDSIEIED